MFFGFKIGGGAPSCQRSSGRTPLLAAAAGSLIALGAISAIGSGCSAPLYDPSTPQGLAAIIDRTHKAVTNGNCSEAIATIEPAYNSEYSTNEVRMARASAHACAAQINFFRMAEDLATHSLVGSDFWKTLSELAFAVNPDDLDPRAASGKRAIDALLAAIKPGKVISNSHRIETDEFNIGSMLASDRDANANLYLILTTMTTLGILQNRYSAPSSTTFEKAHPLGYTVGQPKGWVVTTGLNAAVSEDGCAFASGFLNMIDAIDGLGADLGGSTGESLRAVSTAYNVALAQACDAGCNGTSGVFSVGGENIDFTDTGCNLGVGACVGDGVRACPIELRNRMSCTGVVTNRASCAAAGIVQFINEHTTMGWLGP